MTATFCCRGLREILDKTFAKCSTKNTRQKTLYWWKFCRWHFTECASTQQSSVSIVVLPKISVVLHGYLGCAIQELGSPKRVKTSPCGHITVPDSTPIHLPSNDVYDSCLQKTEEDSPYHSFPSSPLRLPSLYIHQFCGYMFITLYYI
jgi:hypothetical protein